MTDEQSAQADNVGMTDDEERELYTHVAHSQRVYREYEPIETYYGFAEPTEEQMNEADDAIVAYVNGLLAARDAEIARLQARQITPAMEAVWTEYQTRKANNTLTGEVMALVVDLWGAFKAMKEGRDS